jgi:hypothetical protein
MKMANIYNNDVSQFHTHFLAGPELIRAGRDKYGIASENFAYPTMTSVGGAKDDYYAEIWVDGMDWHNTYWILEHAYYETSVAIPLLVFRNINEERSFNPFDMHDLFRAAMTYRRNRLGRVNRSTEWTPFRDRIWPNLYLVSDNTTSEMSKDLASFVFEHNSQPAVTFYMNKTCVPLLG